MLTTVKLGLRKPADNDAFGQDDFGFNSDTLEDLLGIRAVRVYHSVTQSIAHDTSVVLAFNSERADEDAMHDVTVNNGRLIAKRAGWFLAGGHLSWTGNATGFREITLRRNGVTLLGVTDVPSIGAGSMSQSMPPTLAKLALNDWIEIVVYQNSTVALSVQAGAEYTPEFWMARWPG